MFSGVVFSGKYCIIIEDRLNINQKQKENVNMFPNGSLRIHPDLKQFRRVRTGFTLIELLVRTTC